MNKRQTYQNTYCGASALYIRLRRITLNSKLVDKLDTFHNSSQCEYYRKILKILFDPSTSSECYWTLLIKDSFKW